MDEFDVFGRQNPQPIPDSQFEQQQHPSTAFKYGQSPENNQRNQLSYQQDQNLQAPLTLFQFQNQLQQPQQPSNLLQFSSQPDYESIFGIDQYDVNQNQDFYKPEFEEEQGIKPDNMGQTVSFSMPGAFRTDNMDLDDSNPFPIDLGLYIEPTIVSTEKPPFNRQNVENLKIEASLSPFDDSSRASSYSNVNYDNMTNQNEAFLQESQNGHNLDKESYLNGYQNTQVPRNHSFSNASLSVTNNNLYNELSPLTTTTSLTPSVGSIHSTQPSFFSANQYITRNSLEQPPSSLHRQSFDYYSKNRASMDSQQSSQHQRNGSSGRYTSFTNSITNMLPFIGDRNQRSPVSGPTSPKPPISTHSQSPQQASHQQSRHLIRSIFKSSINNANSNDLNLHENADINVFQNNENVYENDNQFDQQEDHDILMSPHKDENDYENPESLPVKKAKRSKRSLFTRFKTPVKHETEGSDLTRTSDEVPYQAPKSLDNESLENSMTGNVSLQTSSISQTPSMANSNPNLDTTSLNNSHSGNSQSQPNQTHPEPDYAALFENVGKRKHIVSTSSYRKTKSKVKSEEGHEKSSILGLGNKPKVKIENDEFNDGYLLNRDSFNSDKISQSDSMSGSSTSSLHNRGTEISPEDGERSASSSLASASKRILGSKLTSKKKPSQNTVPAATMISKGVEVEVDLESLDLPPTTQIFPTSIINSKNRTRGRKENKEADMLDTSKIFLCNYCSRRFKRQEHLKRHFRSLHTLEKPYDCTICQKKFSRSDNLNQHLKTHKLEEEMANRMAQKNEMNLDVLKEEF